MPPIDRHNCRRCNPAPRRALGELQIILDRLLSADQINRTPRRAA